MRKRHRMRGNQKIKKGRSLSSTTGKNLQKQGTTPPLQPPQSQWKENAARFAKGVKDTWFWASFPSVALSAWFNLVPHVSISTSTNADDSSSFGTLISVTNSSHFSISDVRVRCLINSPGFLENVSLERDVSPLLDEGHSLVSNCGINSPGYQRAATILVQVRYKWAWGIFPSKEEVSFVSQKDVHGRSFMVPQSLK